MGHDRLKTHSPRSRRFVGLGLAAGLIAHVWLGVGSILRLSPTFDEPLHLTAGFVYLSTGDYRMNGLHHPPLSSLAAAIPLLAASPEIPRDHPLWTRRDWSRADDQYRFAHDFLYKNRVSADRMMTWGRCSILFLSCLFLLFLFRAMSTVTGPLAGWCVFVLGVFSPSFLAHGTLVTTDYLFTAFYFSFFYFMGRLEQEQDRLSVAGAALSLGFMMCSKFSFLAVGPVLALRLVYKKPAWSLRSVILVGVGAAVTVSMVYHVTGVPVFLEGLRYTYERLQGGRSSFLLGQHGTTGWWYYFPVAFLLKSTLPELAGMVWLAALAWKKKIRLPWWLILPPAVYFAIACASSVQIGHRHILPVYPFLYAALAVGIQSLWDTHRRWFVLGGILQAATTLMVSPFFISYFNEAVGGSRHGYRYMSDSNVDWGQGLRELKRYMVRQNIRGIYLSYFGTGDPRAYGIAYVPVAGITMPPMTGDSIDAFSSPRTLFAISATNYQHTYYADKNLFRWLRQRDPVALVARSILVFDITDDADARRELESISHRTGEGPRD
ncbi:MAG TPA: hypothetical protein PK876_05895 [Elusimicrobiota bacterium]|nr:hypothetical protein [Elusimicrobiota bacterium]